MIDTTSGQPDDRAVAFQGKLDVGLDARRFQITASQAWRRQQPDPDGLIVRVASGAAGMNTEARISR